MPLERAHVRGIVDTYVRAWQQQDPDLIVTIFTEDATYHERVLGAPIRTRAGIHRYWREKVVANQATIIANQETIQENQGKILANQQTIISNQGRILNK